MRLRAIIYVPNDEDQRKWDTACLAYCARRGYQVVARVVDGPGQWDQVFAMFKSGEAEVVVVARSLHLPSDRLPRIESVTEDLPRIEDAPRHRRTRIIRRDEEA